MKIAIYGAGGHGKVVCDAMLQAGLDTPVGFVDDDSTKRGTSILGLPVLGDITRLSGPADVTLAMGIGDNDSRRRAFEDARARGYSFVTVVHPSAIVGRERCYSEE